MRNVLACLWAVLFAGATSAQDADIDPPLAGRPTDFSGLVGRYRVSMAVEPTEVFVEDPLLLKVRITGQGPERYRPRRERLHLFPAEVVEQFHVEPLPDRDRVYAAEQTWEFVYRLRPRSVSVDAVPGVRLVYYLVSPNRRSYQTTYADAVPLVVKPKPPAEPKDLVLRVVEAPERFFVFADETEASRAGDLSPAWLLLPPLAALGWYVAWRRWFPDRVTQRQRQRSRAARQALRALESSSHRPETTLEVLSEYLRQRLDFPGAEPTSREIGQFLRRRGVARELREGWVRFYQQGEERRFTAASAPNADHGWQRQAPSLITALEADPCLANER